MFNENCKVLWTTLYMFDKAVPTAKLKVDSKHLAAVKLNKYASCIKFKQWRHNAGNCQ